jgi:phosphoadenosine phosphosulfate reductase
MKLLYSPIKEIAEQCRNVSVMFSCGRDSIVMFDLFMQHARESVGEVVFMYYCPGLSYEETILTYYEKRYGTKITRIAHPDVAYLVNTRTKGKKIRVANVEKVLKVDHGAEWVAWGFRKDESLQRRGQLTMAKNGIDWKYRKLFPLTEWSKKHTQQYVHDKKLLLPVEYRLGFRDLNTFKGDSLLYIYNSYPEDYNRIIQIYPDVEGELRRLL